MAVMGADTQAPARGLGPEPVREAYLRALLDADVPVARRLLDEAVTSGLSVPRVYLEVLRPTLYEIGRRWSHAEISVAQEPADDLAALAAQRGAAVVALSAAL